MYSSFFPSNTGSIQGASRRLFGQFDGKARPPLKSCMNGLLIFLMCSQRRDCQASDLPLRWLSYTSNQCPLINRVQPSQVQRDKERLLTLNISNLPEFQTNAAYRCQFSPISSDSTGGSGGDGDTAQVAAYASEANRTRDTFQCYTPPKAKLPPFETGSDSVKMTLSVLVNNQELVSETIVFFDCGLHTSCTACTLSQNSCSWCIKNHLCTDNTDKHCNTDDNVLGVSAKVSSPKGLQGPDKCPRFESFQDTDNEILVGVGSSPHVQVRALALQPNYQLSDVRCQFVMDEVKEVEAYVEKVPGTDKFNITCKSVLFTYVREEEKQNVPFKVLWGGADNPLDNPQGVKVVMYKCGEMAKTCGDCFTIEEKYKCGWCDTKRCSTAQFCKGRPGGFLLTGSVCPNPRITKFYPKSGPLKGGTKVTIEGQNLGTNKKEVEVQIDMYKCDVEEFEAPKRIVCKTQLASLSRSAPVRVIVGNDAGQKVMAESTEPFSFVQPRLTDISPIAGVVAGGTIVTLIGEHLDAGSRRAVLIGQNACTDVRSVNATAITCKTTAAVETTGQPPRVSLQIDDETFTASGVVFTYVQNPNVTWLSRHEVIQSGGLVINVSGENLQNVQTPKILIWHKDVAYAELCTFSRVSPSTNMSCLSPNISGLEPEEFSSTSGIAGLRYLELDVGFQMDAVKPLLRAGHLGKVRVYRDPVVEAFPGAEAQYQPSQGILIIKANHLEPLKPSDVRVQIGQEECEIKSVSGDIITCEPPASEPAALVGNGFPEVMVVIGEKEHSLGVLRYEKQEELSEEAMFAIIGCAAFLLIMLITGGICCLIKFRRNDDMMKKMRKDMDQLESRVANECKDAFAELQTDMSELTSDLSGGGSIPFWDYRTYCMRVLFPPDCNDHAVIRELELEYHNREDMERGLQLFFNLIRNKTFLLIFIRTLESNNGFHLRDRVNVASLISVTLQTQMEYATEILKTLLADLIEKTVENPKAHAKLLLRRNESVAEKMLTNWFTFLLYKFLKECAGEPLFMLYGAIKQQVSKGPVDAITGEARYSLSEDKLLRQHINYRPMVLYVMDIDVDRCPQPAYPVKVLDCDTISQVKEKILDAIYKSAPFSSRPPKEELDLEWIVGDKTEIPMKMFPNKETKRLVLSDEDHTTKSEGDCKRLNTLSHYKVPDGAYVALHPKQTSIYNMSIMSEKSKYSENSYYNRSPSLSLNRSLSPPSVQLDVEGCKVYHLVRHQDVESNSKEGERGSKMVTEIYLPRLLVTKGTLQTFVDDLFERIFSTTHRGTVMPLATKYMFDFLDDQAMLHNMGDDVVHTWKSNSLPLRYWVNVIKNPNFAFNIYKSNIVDACLTVIGQTFMDCCSTLEHKLTKESPSGKLLYAKDIPKYKQWVASYYQDIKIMPAISDQDMTAMLAEESRAHSNEFNTNAALLELWEYVRKYYDDIVTALEDDEFAKKSRLTHKLDQVAAAMDGSAMC
ncbi:plexin-A2-like [Elysia marginata]|uniref:Plexin-A2-like n=1 Tax=Elysia marginata TaxID=1093978 RepID=A0AAV4IV55_9GAST|nr:plexin-A2-like [Elysia marginata]